MTETTNGLAQAMAALQMRLPEIKKDQNANTGSYSYSYADLAQITREIMPLLGELGLSFMAKPAMTEAGQFVLAYKLLHVSGEFEEGAYPLPAGGNPQAIGSAITYARRYCLCAVTGIAPEDDDDDAAAAQAEAARKQNTGGRRQEWRAPAESQPQPASNGNGAATKPQLQKLHVLFGKAEWTDRADRLRAASALAGRELTSATEMTKQEASRVIDALQKVVDGPDPAMRLGELVSAATNGGES